MNIEFTRVESLGNRFILIDDAFHEVIPPNNYSEIAIKLCNHTTGIRADACIFVKKTVQADAKIIIIDSRGNSLPVCGNGTRCTAGYLFEKFQRQKHEFSIEVHQRIIGTVIRESQGSQAKVSMDMGRPLFNPRDIPALFEGESIINQPLNLESVIVPVTVLSLGNPHAVVIVDNLEEAPVTEVGPLIENHRRFPEKINVEFVRVINPRLLKMRIWERGEGETSSCATGACASLITAHLQGLSGLDGIVSSKGGEFEVIWDKDQENIQLSGPILLNGCGSVELA